MHEGVIANTSAATAFLPVVIGYTRSV